MIPKKVIDKSNKVSDGIGKLALLGHIGEKEVYGYVYDDIVTVGIPQFLIWDGKTVEHVQDEAILDEITWL